jgi:hypothetical protein
MDYREKKMFLQFDDDMPAQRANALEMLREEMKKKTPPRFFRDMVAEFENAVPPAKLAAVEKELADFKAANATAKQTNDQLTQRNTELTREVARWKATAQAAVAIRVNWKKLAAGVAVVALLGGAYYWWGPGAAAAEERERVNAFYRASLEKTAWQEGERGPLVGMIAGKPYWMMIRGETEETHVDNQGRPVVLQCSHVFAVPAVADWSGAYQPPKLSNLFGWFHWPERAKACKVAAAKQQLSDAAPNRPPSCFQLLSAEDEIPDPATPDDPPAELLHRAQEAQRAMRELSSPSPAYGTGDGRDMDRLIKDAVAERPLAPCPVDWQLNWHDRSHPMIIAENSRNCIASVNGGLDGGATPLTPHNRESNGHPLQVPKGAAVIVTERWRNDLDLYTVKLPDGTVGTIYRLSLKPGAMTKKG